MPLFYGLLCLASNTRDNNGDNTSAGASERHPELHLNIWEREVSFLDIGLKVPITQPEETLYLLFPWGITEDDVEDLSDRIIREKGAVNAVFNESWDLTIGHDDGAYVSDPASGEALFTIISLQNSFSQSSWDSKGGVIHGIAINVPSLRGKSISRSPTAKEMYVRFRVKNIPKTFYRVGIEQKDQFFLSSWQRTEIIDFRVNVRRGIPVGLEKLLNAHFLSFKKVHLFLMKPREEEIAFQDSLFKSCRSLEDENFWAAYSLDSAASAAELQMNLKNIKNSLGYQWTKLAPLSEGGEAFRPIREYSTLARFKTLRFGMASFIFSVLIFGAAGNGIWEGGKSLYLCVKSQLLTMQTTLNQAEKSEKKR